MDDGGFGVVGEPVVLGMAAAMGVAAGLEARLAGIIRRGHDRTPMVGGRVEGKDRRFRPASAEIAATL